MAISDNNRPGDYKLPPTTVAVTNFNGGQGILKCLDAVMRQNAPLAEVLVVDNGSTDKSLADIRTKFLGARIIQLAENRGPGAARNAALSAAASDLLLLIDSDVYLAPDCLQRLVSAQQAFRAALVCPRICLLPEVDVVQADGAAPHFIGTMLLRHGYWSLSRAAVKTTAIAASPGGCMLLDRRRALAVGGFDEIFFFYFEDLEFSLRMHALGHLLVCEPAAVVHHERGTGVIGLAFRGHEDYPAQRAYLTCRNRLLLMFVHYRLRTLLALSPALMLYELASMCLAVRRGWTQAWVAAWLWQVANWRAIRHRRCRIQNQRKVDDKDVLVGGPLPLAPGLIRSPIAGRAVNLLSAMLNAYWRHAPRWIA
jgi:GT2 family glycosyltransferase